jgi:hypothetical protein
MPRARSGARCRAGHLAGNGTPDDPDPNDEPFRVFEFGGFGLAGCFGVEEKPSAPHTRLAYIHLQILLLGIYRPLFERVTAACRVVNGIAGDFP